MYIYICVCGTYFSLYLRKSGVASHIEITYAAASSSSSTSCPSRFWYIRAMRSRKEPTPIYISRASSFFRLGMVVRPGHTHTHRVHCHWAVVAALSSPDGRCSLLKMLYIRDEPRRTRVTNDKTICHVLARCVCVCRCYFQFILYIRAVYIKGWWSII